MINIELKLDKKKKYVVACSFGPDSMALLYSAIKEKINIVVAHVNYRKREASQFEEDSLKKYCENKNIKCFVLDLKGVNVRGNFQDWARKRRYEFFKEIAEKEHADAVLVAHQQDDLIETYLMQKNRGNFVKKWGISGENELFGIKIIRPLLSYSKESLQKYDDENNVPYSIDQSNLTDHYSRNKIRHSMVENLSIDERKAVIKEIEDKTITQIEIKQSYSKEEFLCFDYSYIVQLFDYFMGKLNEHRNISKSFVAEIKKAIATKTTLQIELTKSLLFELDYGIISFIYKSKLKSYKCSFIEKFKNEFIEIDFSGNTSDRGFDSTNKEFIIKNCNKKDKIIIKDYECEIRRLFIDWKMPLYLREIWPGIYDENMNLLYVPRYRKEFEDNHKSKFIIDTEYFKKF